jgi:hypothetical protein
MAANNQLVFQEGTEIIVDSGVASPAGAWVFDNLSVVRSGPLVVMHLEAHGGTGTIFTLPADFAPSAAVTDGTTTVATSGVVAKAASPAQTTLAWVAAQASP